MPTIGLHARERPLHRDGDAPEVVVRAGRTGRARCGRNARSGRARWRRSARRARRPERVVDRGHGLRRKKESLERASATTAKIVNARRLEGDRRRDVEQRVPARGRHEDDEGSATSPSRFDPHTPEHARPRPRGAPPTDLGRAHRTAASVNRADGTLGSADDVRDRLGFRRSTAKRSGGEGARRWARRRIGPPGRTAASETTA